MVRLTVDLQRSREHLVTVREEELRRPDSVYRREDAIWLSSLLISLVVDEVRGVNEPSAMVIQPVTLAGIELFLRAGKSA
jgi:hypothetical protein